jgi:hypothetical protein
MGLTAEPNEGSGTATHFGSGDDRVPQDPRQFGRGQLLSELQWFNKSWKWEGLQAVGKVRREVQRSRDGPPGGRTLLFMQLQIRC